MPVKDVVLCPAPTTILTQYLTVLLVGSHLSSSIDSGSLFISASIVGIFDVDSWYSTSMFTSKLMFTPHWALGDRKNLNGIQPKEIVTFPFHIA